MQYFNPTFLLAILIAVTVHEAAHAYAAWKLGDPTAKYDGRITLNPLAHLDPLGTILFLLVGFGWGKPVPVDPRYFKKPIRDNAIVAFAGPLSNILLAFAAMLLASVVGNSGPVLSVTGILVAPDNTPVLITFLSEFLGDLILINLVLMAFNLLPIAPLDGSKVLRMFLPYHIGEQYDDLMRNGPWILLGLILAGRVLNIPILSWWIQLIIAPFLWAMQSMF